MPHGAALWTRHCALKSTTEDVMMAKEAALARQLTPAPRACSDRSGGSPIGLSFGFCALSLGAFRNPQRSVECSASPRRTGWDAQLALSCRLALGSPRELDLPKGRMLCYRMLRGTLARRSVAWRALTQRPTRSHATLLCLRITPCARKRWCARDASLPSS